MSAQDSSGHGDVADNLDGLSSELQNIEAICSAVPDLGDDVAQLSDHLDDVVERLDESEADLDDLSGHVNDISGAVGQLTEAVHGVEQEIETLNDRQATIETRLEAIEGLFHPDELDRSEAHNEAQNRSIPFDRGDLREIVIKEIEGRPDPQLFGRIEKVATFVDVDDPDAYEEGECIAVKITDLNGTAAHAEPVGKIGG